VQKLQRVAASGKVAKEPGAGVCNQGDKLEWGLVIYEEVLRWATQEEVEDAAEGLRS